VFETGSSLQLNELYERLHAFRARLESLPQPHRDRLIPEFQAILADAQQLALVCQQCEVHRDVVTSERRLLTLLENLPVGIVFTDPQGQFTVANAAVQDLFGSSGVTGDAAGPSGGYTLHRPDGSPFPPDELPLLRSLREGTQSKDVEMMIRRETGEEVILLVNTSPVRAPDGTILGAVAVMQDITERKQVEASLRQSEAREREKAAELQAIMDAVPAFVWVARDPASLRIDGNRAAAEVLRMKTGDNLSKTAPEEERPRHFRVMRHGQEIPLHELPVQIAASQGVYVQNYECDIVFDDGEIIHEIGNAAPLFDDEGRPRGAVSAFIDITARKLAEQALYESELRFRIALASAPIMVYTMDRNLRYTWVYNPSGQVPAGEMVGRLQEEIEPAPEAAETIALKRLVIETGEGIQQEIKSESQGETRYYILNLEPIRDSSGQVMGLTGAVLDVTRQRRLEAERQEFLANLEVQRRLMEHRERERQQIARDIHDGPIQTLVSTLFNLQISKDALHDPMLQVELEQISNSLKSAVRELREVVNELRPPSLLRFGLARAIRIHIEDLREKHPDVRFELDLFEDGEHLPENLCLTLFRIYQESINNVIRHAQATRAWVSLERQDGHLVLEIRDNGKGFTAPEDLTEQTLRGHFGLAGMRERAQAAGGSLTITSQPGGGTVIRVFAPWEENTGGHSPS